MQWLDCDLHFSSAISVVKAVERIARQRHACDTASVSRPDLLIIVITEETTPTLPQHARSPRFVSQRDGRSVVLSLRSTATAQSKSNG
ncbi:hypothetical protein J6590_052979 [Homalodisca vitripennis]|nr:hypothetical protein J6590_052979 [Homalodisca vitripennis]